MFYSGIFVIDGEGGGGGGGGGGGSYQYKQAVFSV